jgi:hypothetical protein
MSHLLKDHHTFSSDNEFKANTTPDGLVTPLFSQMCINITLKPPCRNNDLYFKDIGDLDVYDEHALASNSGNVSNRCGIHSRRYGSPWIPKIPSIDHYNGTTSTNVHIVSRNDEKIDTTSFLSDVTILVVFYHENSRAAVLSFLS